MISEYSPCSKCASGRETKIFAYKIYFIQQKFKEIKLRRKKNASIPHLAKCDFNLEFTYHVSADYLKVLRK